MVSALALSYFYSSTQQRSNVIVRLSDKLDHKSCSKWIFSYYQPLKSSLYVGVLAWVNLGTKKNIMIGWLCKFSVSLHYLVNFLYLWLCRYSLVFSTSDEIKWCKGHRNRWSDCRGYKFWPLPSTFSMLLCGCWMQYIPRRDSKATINNFDPTCFAVQWFEWVYVVKSEQTPS